MWLKWYLMLNKRLLRRFEYILILILVPILIVAISMVSSDKKGIMDISIVLGDDAGSDVKAVAKNLIDEDSIIEFNKLEFDEAKRRLLSGKTDAIWLINETDDVKVYQTDEDYNKSLAREVLFRQLYPYNSYKIYEHYIEKISDVGVDSRDIRKHYDSVFTGGEFIDYEIIGDGKYENDYIKYPLRGFLAVWYFIGVMVANIYYLRDDKNGMFLMMDIKRKSCIAKIYIVSISVNLLMIMLISLAFMGQICGFREIFAGIMLMISFMMIGGIIRKISMNIYAMSAMLLPLSVFLLSTAPIVVNTEVKLSSLNPIYYYLNYIGNTEALLQFLIYIIVLSAVSFVIGRI